MLSLSVAGGQLRWVSLLDAGEGVAVLTPVLRSRSHTSTLCSAGSLPWRLTRGSLHPFVWKMVAPLLQSSVLQKINRGKVPGAWLPDLRAYSAHGEAGLRQPCSKCLEPRVPKTQAPLLMLRNCRGLAAGW